MQDDHGGVGGGGGGVWGGGGGGNSSANQCSFNIFAPPDGSMQKYAFIISLRQWIVHFMIIDSPG